MPPLRRSVSTDCAFLDQRRARDARAVATLAVEAVALRARPVPELLAERRGAGRLLLPPLREPGVELGRRHHLDGGEHLGVVEAAELGALALEDAGALRLEPGLVDPARDCVDLPAERRDPPRVDDVPVRRRDVELDRAPLRRAQPVDRDDAVRVAELPRELRADDVDDEVLAPRARGRDVLDPGQLREDEGSDREQDQHRADRPRQLEAVRPVDLRSVGVPRPVSAAVADHERDRAGTRRGGRSRTRTPR